MADAPKSVSDATRWSPLSDAVEMDDVETVRVLLAAGEDPNGGTGPAGRGFPLLHHAIDLQADGYLQVGDLPSTAMIELLISAGADPLRADERGRTAVDLVDGYGGLSVEVRSVLRRSLQA